MFLLAFFLNLKVVVFGISPRSIFATKWGFISTAFAAAAIDV